MTSSKRLTELTLEEFATTYKNWQGRKRAEKQRARRELMEAGELALLGDRHGIMVPESTPPGGPGVEAEAEG